MSITKLTTNGLTGAKYDTVSADNYYMEPIATTLLASATATVTFSNIPQGYKHLQIRGIYQNNQGTSSVDYIQMLINSDTSSSYVTHRLQGNGTAASAGVTAATVYAYPTFSVQGVTSIYGASIIDILDYANVNKYKTIRTLGGYDANGAGNVGLNSNLWMNTASITNLQFSVQTGSFNTNSRFSLFGVKG
jgi:hypothetical protein